MKLIPKTSSLLLLLAMSGAALADDVTMTIKNNSVYTLTMNSAAPTSGSYCVSAEGARTDCAPVLLPKQEQRVFLGSNTGMNLNYNINMLTGNNYNLNIQNQGNLSFSSSQLTGLDTTLDGDTLTLTVPTEALSKTTQYETLPFRGANLSGAEAGSNYQSSWLPSLADMSYFMQQGMNTARVPINWNFISSEANGGTVNKVYLSSIYSTVQQLLESGNSVVLDLHDYMRYQSGGTAGSGDVVNTEDMAYIWRLLAETMKPLATKYDGVSQPNQLILEIMNEPYGMDTMPTSNDTDHDIIDDTNAAIAAIRQAGLKNLILVEGNQWSGLHSWTTDRSQDGKTNAEAMVPANIHDAGNNYAIAVHEYFDSNGSGTSSTCQPLSNFQTYVDLTDFINWMNTNKVKVFLSEFGSGVTSQDNPNCGQDVNWLLSQIENNAYTSEGAGFIGWTAWVGGHGWNMSDINNLSPNPTTGAQTSQMLDIYEGHVTPPGSH